MIKTRILHWFSGAKSVVMIDKIGNGTACAPSAPKFEDNILHTNYGNTLLLNENSVVEESVGWHGLCYYRDLSVDNKYLF